MSHPSRPPRHHAARRGRRGAQRPRSSRAPTLDGQRCLRRESVNCETPLCCVAGTGAGPGSALAPGGSVWCASRRCALPSAVVLRVHVHPVASPLAERFCSSLPPPLFQLDTTHISTCCLASAAGLSGCRMGRLPLLLHTILLTVAVLAVVCVAGPAGVPIGDQIDLRSGASVVGGSGAVLLDDEAFMKYVSADALLADDGGAS